MITDKEISKNNRLMVLKKVHANRQDKRNEESMGKPNKTKAECDVCGKIAMVGRNHGVMACSMCAAMQALIKRSPEKAVAEIQRMHGTVYFPAIKEAPVCTDCKQCSDLCVILSDIKHVLNMDPADDEHTIPDVARAAIENAESADELRSRLIESKEKRDELLALLKQAEARISELESSRLQPVQVSTVNITLDRLVADPDLLKAINNVAEMV